MTKNDMEIISKIADKGKILLSGIGIYQDKLSLFMDIEYVNDICPLRLNDLLNADDSNFAHDICGIYQNFNRKTKQLENFFVPRYAK